MGLDISKKELNRKIRNLAQNQDSSSFKLEGIENRRRRFIFELHCFRKFYTTTEDQVESVSNVLKICQFIPVQIFLLKIFSENYYTKMELQNKSTFIVMCGSRAPLAVRSTWKGRPP